MDIYQVDIIEPQSGQLRKIYLSNEISREEVRLCLEAAFECATIVGVVDEAHIFYPLSALTILRQNFDGKCLAAVIEHLTLPGPQESQFATNVVVAADEADDLILTEDHAKQAFCILDKNGDGFIHEEEIVDVLTVSYTKFLEYNPRFTFAYSCLSPMNIALATAQSLLSANNDKSLDLDDFYAWYLSGGSVPLRDLTIHALQFVSNTATAAGTASTVSTMKRSKSRTALDLSSLYSDVEVSAFAAQCESLLRLSVGDSLSYLLDLVGLSVKGRSVISHEMYTKVFYVYFLHQEYQLSERDVDIVQVLDSIFAMLSADTGCENEKEGEQEKRVHILDLGSLLCTMSSAKYLQALKTLFDQHPDSHSGLVNSSILASHLCQVLRLIFHFNPGIPEHTGCCPQHLACALSTKVLQVSEARRRSRHKLSFEEFVEAFLHGLMLGLSMLQIDRGYFCDYLERLMTYIGDSPMRSKAHGGGGGRAGEGESSGGEDVEIGEGLQDRSSGRSSSGSSEYESDVDTEAATARLTVSAEDDTLDGLGGWEDQDHS